MVSVAVRLFLVTTCLCMFQISHANEVEPAKASIADLSYCDPCNNSCYPQAQSMQQMQYPSMNQGAPPLPPTREMQHPQEQMPRPGQQGPSPLQEPPALPGPPPAHYKKPNCQKVVRDPNPDPNGYTINFEDISIIQVIRFISQISGTNFIFDSDDLMDTTKNPPEPYKITLVSQDPTQVADLSAALLQILKMYNLSVVEQGNNVLIYKNQNMSKISTVITNNNINDSCDNVVITRVFQLYNVQADKIAAIVRTLISPEGNVEPSAETRHLIVTDITTNVNKIADLLEALDTVEALTLDVASYNVQNADPVTLAEYVREILIPLAAATPLTITPERTSQQIFIVSSPPIIARAKQILASLDVPQITEMNPMPPGLAIENNNFYMYKLKYQSGQEIADALHEIGTNLQSGGAANIDFVNAIYSVQWLEVNNSIVITGTDDAIQKIVSLLNELDQQPKQVYIEVLVIDTTLQNSLDFGVQWIALGDEQDKLAFASGLLGTPGTVPALEGTPTTNPGARFVAANPNVVSSAACLPSTACVPPLVPNAGRDVALPNPSLLNGLIGSNFTEAFGLGIIGNIIRHNGKSFLTLGALLSALDEESDVKVVLNPKIMVEDTQPANFFVGQNIPYQTTSTVIQQTGSVTQNIQYEDVGVELQVTPTISPDNIVTLQINQTVATLATAVGILTPTTNKELVTTRVHVPDGTFLVMSGQVFDTCSYIRSGIPCLGSLPLIGPVFSRNIEQRSKRNLIFFIRPKVVTNNDEGIILTNEEGYDYNWGSNPCSIIECDCQRAPECETYPSPCWPPINEWSYPSEGPAGASRSGPCSGYIFNDPNSANSGYGGALPNGMNPPAPSNSYPPPAPPPRAMSNQPAPPSPPYYGPTPAPSYPYGPPSAPENMYYP